MPTLKTRECNRRAIDKFQKAHKVEIAAYKRKLYHAKKIYDKRNPEFKVFCRMFHNLLEN